MDALTALRFIAALWVVFFHYGRTFLSRSPDFARVLAKSGYVGVSLFFLLSGFVLAYTYLPRVDAGEFRSRAFWWARVARVYPLYLLVLVASLPPPMLHQPLELFVRLGLLQAWLPDHLGGWNLPAWSLSAEAFFYAAFPLAILGASRVGKGWLLPLALAAALLALVPPAGYVLLRPSNVRTAVDHFTDATTILKTNPIVRLPNFLAGVLLGVAYLRLGLRDRLRARPGERRGLLLLGIGAAALLLMARRQVPWELMHNGLFLAPFGLLLVALAPGVGTGASLLSYRAPVFLGEISYAIYVVHAPFHDWITARFFPSVYHRDEDVLFVTYLGALVAASTALHLLVERPAHRWLRGGGATPRTARAAIAALFALLPLSVLAQTPAAPRDKVGGLRLLVFMAKGCPCNARCMPDLALLSQELAPSVPLVGVAVGCRDPGAEAYRRGLGCPFPVVGDPRGALARRLGAAYGLDMVLIDGRGRRVALWQGVGRGTVAALGTALARITRARSLPDPAGFSQTVQTGCPLDILDPLPELSVHP